MALLILIFFRDAKLSCITAKETYRSEVSLMEPSLGSSMKVPLNITFVILCYRFLKWLQSIHPATLPSAVEPLINLDLE